MFALRAHFLTQHVGTTFVLPFAVMDGNSVAVDLTGATVAIAIRLNGADILTGTNADGTISIIEPSSCVATFSASETANLTPAIYRVVLTVTDASGQVTRAHQGNLTVRGTDE